MQYNEMINRFFMIDDGTVVRREGLMELNFFFFVLIVIYEGKLCIAVKMVLKRNLWDR